MKTWKDISLYTFQELQKIIADPNLSDEDKGYFAACEVYGLTEYELDNTKPAKVRKMLHNVAKLFASPEGKAANRIGKYVLNYNPSSLTFGQYIELAFFLQKDFFIYRAHYALASISRKRFRKYKTDGHRERADYFLNQSFEVVIGSLALFAAQLKGFNDEYKDLFGLDEEIYDHDVKSDRFNQRYGWTYSASRVAEYERITLDAAFCLPIRQALNDLSYLKEKDRYEAEQQKKLLNNNAHGR